MKKVQNSELTGNWGLVFDALPMTSNQDLQKLATLIRHHILTSTTEAGSGHPTTCLSATELMTVLFFRHLRADTDRPSLPNNDRVLFSKGHAAPLLYSLYAVANSVTPEELMRLRKQDSPLQGHPTPQFRYAEAATGSLGQGLSIGVGIALNGKYLDKLPYRTFVLMGDGEIAEGSVWEAIQIAAHYRLDNLIGIIDVNRLGQSQETMYGHDVEAYARRTAAFGWHTEVIDGHSLEEIDRALTKVLSIEGRPKMIIAKTEKGKGVSFLSDADGWHGKALPADKLAEALKELGPAPDIRGTIQVPEDLKPAAAKADHSIPGPRYELNESIATRKAFGRALAKLVKKYPQVVSIDGDCKNSTFSEIVAKESPEHYFEMFIAEQNMIGVAAGLANRGKIPFASSFAAFLTRGFDQIRMSAVSEANIKCVGSHVGVSIGQDGPSQMGLEDIAMFRSIHGSTVLYPADGTSAERLTELAILTPGIVYLRVSRPATPILYGPDEEFVVGGSKVLRSSEQDSVTIIGAGVTLYEALKAHTLLKEEGIATRVIDLYSIKPLDVATLQKAAQETRALIVVEDHWYDGGMGDAVLNAFAETPSVPVIKMAVTEMAGSGTPEELMSEAGISADRIVERVKEFLKK